MDGLHKIATLAFEAAETVAIASGVLTIAQTYISIDAESGSTDTLDTITLTSAPANYGVWLLLKAASGDTITISHNSGNIKTANGSNISLTGDKHLYAFHNGTNVFVADAGGSGAPTDATYIVQTASGSLSNEQAMGALATGIVKNTTTTGVQSIAAAGTDYTSPTGTESVSNKTITASSLIATALSLLLGGFRAIFTHSNSADRTYTLPNYDGTLATIAGTETLGGKTLTTPTIASFTNATHDHSNAAGGGQITDAALSSAVGISKGGTGQTSATAAFDALAPTTTAGDLITHNGTDNVRMAMGSALQQIRVNAGATALEYFTPSSATFLSPSPQLLMSTLATKTVVQGTWANTVNGSQMYGNLYTNISAVAINDEFEFEIALAAGTYTFKLLSLKDNTSGIATIRIDGGSIGTIDLYSAGGALNVVNSITSIVVATTGTKVINFKMESKNASSSNYVAYVTMVQFIKTA